jgi:hypothetical protein
MSAYLYLEQNMPKINAHRKAKNHDPRRFRAWFQEWQKETAAAIARFAVIQKLPRRSA